MSHLSKGKKILITGSDGFIGHHLYERLSKEGFFIIRAGKDLDLRHSKICEAITKNIDYVFHFAARMGGIGFITTQGQEVMTNNILINTNMIKAAADNKVEKFFFPSSFCIYPEFLQKAKDAKALKEEDAIPAAPDTFYGWEKLFTEQMLRAYRNEMKVRIGRFVSIYGPGMPYKGGQEKSLPAICRKVIEATDSIEIWGDGKQLRSFLYIDDCLEAIELLMESDINEPLNIGHPESVAITDVADEAIYLSGKNLTKKYNPAGIKGVDVRVANVEKIMKELSWYPKVEFEEGMAYTFDWIKNQMEK